MSNKLTKENSKDTLNSYNTTQSSKSQFSPKTRASSSFSLSSSSLPKDSPAFTIVELLIVVVVIAILAAITIVSYNSITKSAKETTLKSDLNTAAKQLQLDKVRSGSYPANKEQANLKPSSGTELTYTRTNSTFCLQASNPSLPDKTFHITEAGTIEEGTCPQGGTTMQTFTTSQCNALPVYNGSNEEAVITLTDTRGTPQTYQVAKLADNNCWMLNNLKLGSTTNSITLTPADTNIATNFTLPQLYSGSRSIIYEGTNNDYDTPYAFGPVPGDTGSGSTNYGYLYNWSAATAGESRTSHNENAGNAPYSICPANWRLPGGGHPDGTGNELSYLNARMAGYTNNQDNAYLDNYSNQSFANNWQNTGPFKGAFSGVWWVGFGGQGDGGVLWSRSAHPGYSGNAFDARFLADEVYPGDSVFDRGFGRGVRCLLNISDPGYNIGGGGGGSGPQ